MTNNVSIYSLNYIKIKILIVTVKLWKYTSIDLK